eukprot:37628-Pyramimonas_sp.AAC.1
MGDGCLYWTADIRAGARLLSRDSRIPSLCAPQGKSDVLHASVTRRKGVGARASVTRQAKV